MIKIATTNLNEVVALFTVLFEIEDVYALRKLPTTTGEMFSVVINDTTRADLAERWLINHDIKVSSHGIKWFGQQVLSFDPTTWVDVNLGLEMLAYIKQTDSSESVREMLTECDYAIPDVKI